MKKQDDDPFWGGCPLTSSKQVLELEMTSHEMWLAKEVHSLGDWIIRANDGVTWRANSVMPLGEPGIELDDAIQYCIDYYHSKNISPTFQLATYSTPPILPTLLEERGWDIGIVVEAHTRGIHDYQRKTSMDVGLLSQPTDEWLSSFLEGSHRSNANVEDRVSLMLRSDIPKSFAQIRVEHDIACVGLGMVHNEWLGIFRIATLPQYRKNGYATALNDALLSWGAHLGAKHAFLQVEDDNKSAKRIYRKLGFEHSYTYLYRYLQKE